MKKYLSFFLLLFQITFSQKVIKFGDLKFMYKDTTSLFKNENQEFLLRKNLPNGSYLIKNKNDTIALINIEDNKFSGKQLYYQKINTSKNIKYIEKYYEKDFLIRELFFDDKGAVFIETNYKNNLKNGKETIYKDTKILAINNYENDSLRDWKLYYGNSKIKAEGWGGFTYRQNSLTEYEEDGTVKRIISFKDGVPINYVLFYKNGVVKEIGQIDVYEEDVREAYSRGYTNKTKFMNNNKFEKIIFDPTGKKLN